MGVCSGSQIIDYSRRTGHKRRRIGQGGNKIPPQNPAINPPHLLTDKAQKGNNYGSTVKALSSKVEEIISLIPAPRNIAVFYIRKCLSNA